MDTLPGVCVKAYETINQIASSIRIDYPITQAVDLIKYANCSI